MDGKRSLTIGALLTMTVALTGCAATATTPSGGAGPASSGPAPGATGPLTKVGGNAPTSLKATLITVATEGPDELDFADTLNRLSSGAIDLKVAGDWRSGDPNSEAGIVNDVEGGKAELGIIAARGFDTAGINTFLGLQAPSLIDSYDLQTKVLATDWAKKLLDGPRSMGIVGLGYVEGGLRQVLGINRKLTQLSDFQGARIGIRPSRVAEMTMKALGASSTTFVDPAGLDGIEMDVSGVAGNKYDQGATALTGNLVLWARPSVIFANAHWFDGLSIDQQHQLLAAAAEVGQRSESRRRDDASGARDLLCRRGFAIMPASIVALHQLQERLQSVTDELAKDPATKATIDAILAIHGPTDAPDVVAPCPQTPASVPPDGGPTPIDGTWTTSFTKADLIASPLIDPSEIGDGNWGDWAFTFDEGRVSYTQHNDLGSSSTSGTFAVQGDSVTMVLDEGSNAGETFALRWSIYKDTLTFKRDATLGVGPTPFLVKTWTKAP